MQRQLQHYQASTSGRGSGIQVHHCPLAAATAAQHHPHRQRKCSSSPHHHQQPAVDTSRHRVAIIAHAKGGRPGGREPSRGEAHGSSDSSSDAASSSSNGSLGRARLDSSELADGEAYDEFEPTAADLDALDLEGLAGVNDDADLQWDAALVEAFKAEKLSAGQDDAGEGGDEELGPVDDSVPHGLMREPLDDIEIPEDEGDEDAEEEGEYEGLEDEGVEEEGSEEIHQDAPLSEEDLDMVVNAAAEATGRKPLPTSSIVELDQVMAEINAVKKANVVSTAEYARMEKRKADTEAELLRIADESEREKAGLAPRMETAVAVPEDAQLALNRQGYQAFEMDGGIEFLVAETADGRLDLTDSYILDVERDAYSRPGMIGEIPAGPAPYQAIPVMWRTSGDIVKMKEETESMLRVLFVSIESTRPYRLSLEHVYCFDAASRSLDQEEVHRVGENIRQPVLRILPEGLFVQDSSIIPSPIAVAMDGLMDTDATTTASIPNVVDEEQRQEQMDALEKEDLTNDNDDLPDLDADMLE